jgi:hypothetical protein
MDSFVPFIPLIVLPILLLFNFLGCGLPTSGSTGPLQPPFEMPVTLHIADDPNIADGLWDIKVTFTFTPTQLGLGVQNTVHLLAPDEITPNKIINDFNVAPLHEDGTVDCTCVITFGVFGEIDSYADGAVAVTANQDKVEGEPLPEFILTRVGDDFFVTPAPFGMPVTLHIAGDPNIADGLWDLSVTFSFTPTQSSLGVQTTEHILLPDEITPNKVINDFNVAPLSAGGTVYCTCVITFGVFGGIDSYADGAVTVTAYQDKGEDEQVPEFILTREGDDFFLTPESA